MKKSRRSFAVAFASGLVAFATVSFNAASAMAASMTCLAAVHTVKTLTDETGNPADAYELVTIPLDSAKPDIEVKVAGETVAVFIDKKEFADVYDVTFRLTTPVALRYPRSTMVADVSDSLYNDGPTKENSFDILPGPGATRFSYLRREGGSFGFSTVLIEAMKAAGVWGVEFKSAVIGATDFYAVTQFIQEQVKAGKLKPNDVMGLATAFSCTHRN